MKPMADEHALLDGADFFLSILPPGEVENLAHRLAPTLSALAKKPIYVDCNAISPQTAQRVAAIVEPTGAAFVDGGIIGGPPRPGYSPGIYASGPAVGQTAVLRDWGLDWRAIDGPIGAASGLKMSYAGITKGITALGSAMMLGAARFGCAEALLAELAASQPQPAQAPQRQHPPHVRQGLSLGRRDGGNRRFPQRQPAIERHLPGHRQTLRVPRRRRSRKPAGGGQRG